jgi:hypothetical protein
MLIYDGAFTSCKLDPDRTRVQAAKTLARHLVQSANLGGATDSLVDLKQIGGVVLALYAQ